MTVIVRHVDGTEKRIDEKVCGKCEQLLPHHSFHKSKKNKDGLQAWCKKCILANQRENAIKKRHGVPSREKKETTFVFDDKPVKQTMIDRIKQIESLLVKTMQAVNRIENEVGLGVR